MRLLHILIVLASMTFLSSCSKNPVTGRRMLSVMSEEQELKVGAESDPQIVAQFGLYEDSKMQNFINAKGKEMGRISHRPDLEYTFRILDSPVVNAFALPGGYVYFTRGIMAHFNNEAEFAGVLGHEIGHITGRHSAKQQTKQIFSQGLLIAGIIIKPDLAQFADVAQQGLGLMLLKNSRDHESQSDKLGVMYSSIVGYDSHEMADFFQTLRRLSEDAGASIPTFMSTHPDPTDRYNNVHEYTEEQQAKRQGPFKVNRDQYLNLINGIVYGDDPRQGYTENNMFYHPDLKFQFPYPNGWKLNNSPAQVQIAEPNGKALMIFTVAQEKTLEAAFNAQVKESNLQVVDKQGIKVNGMQAYACEFIQQGQNGNIRIMTYLVKKDNYIYKFHGLATEADYRNFSNTFTRNFSQFNNLTDASKINKKPEVINIVKVSTSGTLQSALQQAGMKASRFKELAILNGMELRDQVKAGEKIKVIGTKA